jgi:hypothetical protein
MLVKQFAVKNDQRLTLFVCELVGRRGLLLVDLYAFLFDYDEASIYPFHFGY